MVYYGKNINKAKGTLFKNSSRPEHIEVLYVYLVLENVRNFIYLMLVFRVLENFIKHKGIFLNKHQNHYIH